MLGSLCMENTNVLLGMWWNSLAVANGYCTAARLHDLIDGRDAPICLDSDSRAMSQSHSFLTPLAPYQGYRPVDYWQHRTPGRAHGNSKCNDGNYRHGESLTFKTGNLTLDGDAGLFSLELRNKLREAEKLRCVLHPPIFRDSDRVQARPTDLILASIGPPQGSTTST